MLLLLLLSLGFGFDMLEQEIQETRKLISLLKEKNEQLSRLKEELTLSNIKIPEEDEWRSMPGLIPQPDHDSLPSRLTMLSKITHNTISLDFIALKSKDSNPKIGVVVCSPSLISVFTLNGDLIDTYALDGNIFCAGSSTPDDPMISIVNNLEITILGLDANNTIRYIASRKITNDTAVPTALISYSRIGKKYWLVGDSWGRVGFYSGTGDLIGQGSTGTTRVTLLDKYGSQVIFAGDNKVGVFNLATMEPYSNCEPTISNIIDATQDQQATVIYALTEGGDIFIYDTKYASSSSGPTCKSIARLSTKHPADRISVVKGSILAISDNILASFNTTGIENEVFYPPVYYKVSTSQQKLLIKSLRVSSVGNFLVVYGNSEIMCFEVSGNFVVKTAGDWFDFDGAKILLMIFTVGGVFLWRSLKNNSKKAANYRNEEKRPIKPKNSSKKVKFNETPQTFTYSDSDN